MTISNAGAWATTHVCVGVWGNLAVHSHSQHRSQHVDQFAAEVLHPIPACWDGV